MEILDNLAGASAKSAHELAYWEQRKQQEGGLHNTHYERFYTVFFGLDKTFYDGKRILDIGCGPRGSLEWADNTAERVGLDPLADEYRKLNEGHHSMQYVAAPSERIPFPDGYFDVVCSFNSLDHVDDLSETIAEIKRVLAPGGLFLLLTDVNHEPTACEPICFSWDIAEKFNPEFLLIDSRCFEKPPNGIYASIDTPYNFADSSCRYGVFAAKFKKNVYARSDLFISITIPTYNRAHYISDAIASALAQSYQNFEIIVVDDGSTDATAHIVSTFNDPKLRYVLKEHSGAPATRNRCIAEARGDYVLWLDSDDRLLPGTLQLYAQVLHEVPDADVLYGNLDITDTSFNRIKIHEYPDWYGHSRELLAEMFLYNAVPNPGTLVRKELYKRFGGYDETFPRAHDYEFWVRICKEAVFKHAGCTVVQWRWHDSNMSSGTVEIDTSYDARIINKMLQTYSIRELTPSLGWGQDDESDVTVKAWIAAANRLLLFKDVAGSAACLEKACRLQPDSEMLMTLHELKAIEQQMQGGAGKVQPGTPLVSVIVPTYNRPEMLQAAIQSILNQTFHDYEILVVNDAGQDVTAIIDACCSPKIRYLTHETNKGLAAARNTGIRAARGKYIAYLDDDDRYYPDHLDTLVSHLESTGHPVAYTEAHRACQQVQGDSYEVIKRDVPFSRDCNADTILVDNCTPVLCVMHRRDCLDVAGMFDESLQRHEDWELWIRLSRHYQFDHIRKTTCEFSHRLDESTMSSSNPFHFLASYRHVCHKHRKDVEGKPWIQRMQKQVEWNFLYAGYEYVEQQVAPLLIPTSHGAADQNSTLRELQAKGITDGQIAAAAARLTALSGVADDARLIGLLREALQHDSEYLSARFDLVSRLMKTGELAEAAEHLQFLLAMKPGDPDLSCALADMYIAQGQDDAAADALRIALETDENNPELLKRLEHRADSKPVMCQPQVKPDCSIIIPVCNKLDMTQPCLEAVKRWTSPGQYELIVVDNASTDGTADYLASCTGVQVLTNQENIGFAKACNQGASAAGTETLLFLNNDTVVHEGWLAQLLNCAVEHPEAGIIGCRLLYPDGTVQHAGVGITVDGVGEHLFAGFPADYPVVLESRKMQAVTAACMLVRRACFDAIGGFDEQFVNGYEDVDFCLKAIQQGFGVHYCPHTRIIHYEESTPGRNAYEAENKRFFVERWANKIPYDYLSYYESAGLIKYISCDDADDAFQRYGFKNGALFMYLQIIERFPDAAGAYLNLARILAYYQRFGDAMVFIDKALRIVPAFRQALQLKEQLPRVLQQH